MKFLKCITFALVLLAALTGCQKGDEVAIKQRSKYLSSTSDGVFFAVKASGDWTLTVEFPAGTEAWAKLSRTQGSGDDNVIFDFAANEADTPREATVVLRGAGSEASATYTQARKPAP